MLDADGKRRPSARAIEPPPDTGHAVRGNLYATVELWRLQTDAQTAAEPVAGQLVEFDVETTRLAEKILGIVQTTYYTAKGAQSQVLGDAMRQVHEFLRAANSQRADAPLCAGLTCAALLNGVVTIASSGPSLVFVAGDDIFEQFPSQPGTLDMALGYVHEPQMQTYRRQIQAGSILFVGGSSWLSHLPVRTLLGAIAQADPHNSAEITDFLNQQSNFANIPGLLVMVEPADGERGASGDFTHTQPPAPSPARPPASPSSGPTSAPPSKNPPDSPRMQATESFGLPTAVHAAPPVGAAPSATRPTGYNGVEYSSAGSVTTSGSDAQTQSDFAPVDRRAPRAQTMQQIPLPAQGPLMGTEHSGMAPTESPLVRTTRGAFNQVQTSVQSMWGLVTGLLPERTPLHEAPATEATQPELDASPAWQPAIQTAAQSTVPGAVADNPSSEQAGAQPAASWQKLQTFTPPERASGSRARLFILLAVAILVLTPVIVLAVLWQRGASVRAEGELLVDAAHANFRSAEAALDIGDNATARMELSKAQNNLAEASVLLGNTQAISVLSQEIERELQQVLQISPLYGLVEPLVRFPLEANPHRLLIVDQDIYVLDTGRHLVQRFRMDAERQFVTDPDGEIVLQRGEVIDGLTVGPLVAMTWQDPIPGIEDKANLLVLDANHNVFRYNQRVEGATALTFAEQESWQTPSQIQSYLGRFYVADNGRGQIYRYDPGAYEVAPQPWLVAPVPEGLAGLLTMAIEGDIWLLYSNGLLLRYSQGQQVPFALETDVGLVNEPVDMFVGDQDNSSIYLADAGQERILVYNKDGGYERQLQAAEGAPLRELSGIYVDEVAGVIYILTKSSIFQHPLPQ